MVYISSGIGGERCYTRVKAALNVGELVGESVDDPPALLAAHVHQILNTGTHASVYIFLISLTHASIFTHHMPTRVNE